MAHVRTCPIWGEPHQATEQYNAVTGISITDSPRAGGKFIITDGPKGLLDELPSEAKVHLTSLLVDQRMRGVEVPEVTESMVASAATKRPLPVHERADRLLRYIAQISDAAGDRIQVQDDFQAAYAWSESTTVDEIIYLTSYLQQSGWIGGADVWVAGMLGTVTVDGYRRIEEEDTNPDSSQAFVAMWFHETMDHVFAEGIQPGIEDAGYTALRVDRTEHINKIDDEIIAGIRRSRFLVADFTQGDDGARGGVYYEAGFAAGLAIPVIYTCRNGGVDDLAFDTRQYNHILWETPKDLRKALRDRIGRVIGDGPGAAA